MIQVISKITIKEKMNQSFIDLFEQMIEPTKKEVGLVQYELYKDEDDSSVFVVLEKWEEKLNFDKHLQSDHFKKIAPKMSELLELETEVYITKLIA